MTTRDFLNTIITMTAESNDVTVVEVHEKATAMLAAADKANANKRAKPSKISVANAPIKDAILAYVSEHGASLASSIATALEISTPKASSLCAQLVEDNKLTVAEEKIPKVGKRKVYAMA